VRLLARVIEKTAWILLFLSGRPAGDLGFFGPATPKNRIIIAPARILLVTD
jgi:hypothetical protein